MKEKPNERPFPDDFDPWINEWQQGNPKSLNSLIELIYKELQKAARIHLRNHAPNATLSTHSLIHEVYIRLAGTKNFYFNSMAQFFAFIGRLMRHILVDRARAHFAQKRGAGAVELPLDEWTEILHQPRAFDEATLLALDGALRKLSQLDPRQTQIVEMRFFLGLKHAEIAEILDLSETTVKREWLVAKRWLARELGPNQNPLADS